MTKSVLIVTKVEVFDELLFVKIKFDAEKVCKFPIPLHVHIEPSFIGGNNDEVKHSAP